MMAVCAVPEATAGAQDLLDLLGIGDRAEQTPGVLSGGQRQRLAIARALDSEGDYEVLELFRRLHQGGQTILLVTHDQPADAAQRSVRIKDGCVVADGGVPTTTS
jgi:putative ABC transport system ATP-binding protein